MIKLKKEYTECIRENTDKLAKLCHLGEKKKNLERHLDAKQAEVAMDSSGQRKLEEVRLSEEQTKKIIRLQKEKIGNLQSELLGLIRKTGPVPKIKVETKLTP
ncbi:hypothetical protein HMI54_000567 [Coelomomyces lativittatus]|nr:hypothetical protein HMI54_000567 [Coelomomyces lativittatus]